MDTATLEVYANNIQPTQIIKRLKAITKVLENIKAIYDDLIEINPEWIEKERGFFLDFLKENNEKGRTWKSQLDAWQVYDFSEKIYELLKRGYVPNNEYDETVWLNEIESIFSRQADYLGLRELDMDNLYYDKIHHG